MEETKTVVTETPVESAPPPLVVKEDAKKKRRKTRRETYATYHMKVLKQVHPNLGISSKAMAIMDSMTNDLFDRIMTEVKNLMKKSGTQTVTAREIQTAIRFLFPGELAKHAISESTKAVTKYTHSFPPPTAV